MNCIASKERVIAWLKKHGWPEKPSNEFMWAISPETGKVPEESYKIWDGNWESFLKDRKLVLRRKDLKTYTHIHLDSEPGESERRGMSPENGSAMMPPELVNERNELAKRAKEIQEREAYLRQWEIDLRDMDIEIKKSSMMTIKLGVENDQRAASTMTRLKEYEDHLNRRKANDEEYIRALAEAEGEISELKEKHLIFGKVSYTIDKIAMSMAIRGLKNLSDEELKKLPPGFMEDFAKYLADRAERELFKTIPEAYALVGESFLRLPSTVDKFELCRIIMSWLIETDLAMFNKLGKEVVEEFKERKMAS